jgi:hypothetical protein
MKVEVMAAGVAAQQLRRDGHGGGEQDECEAGKPALAGERPRSHSRNLERPKPRSI